MNSMDAIKIFMLVHRENQSLETIIKKFQHLDSNLDINDNQILQHIQALQKKTQNVKKKL
jgi:hypothetical protein